MRWWVPALSVPVVALLTQPLWAPQLGVGVLGEVAAAGPVGAPVAVAVFLVLVAFYCRLLARLLEAVPRPLRRRSARSVWLMFAVPVNFVEDVVIVHEISASLRSDGRVPAPSVLRWTVLGHAWCAAQIVSLLPGVVGVATGGAALVLWATHWVLTGRLVRVLTTRSGLASTHGVARG